MGVPVLRISIVESVEAFRRESKEMKFDDRVEATSMKARFKCSHSADSRDGSVCVRVDWGRVKHGAWPVEGGGVGAARSVLGVSRVERAGLQFERRSWIQCHWNGEGREKGYCMKTSFM